MMFSHKIRLALLPPPASRVRAKTYYLTRFLKVILKVYLCPLKQGTPGLHGQIPLKVTDHLW